MQAEFVSNNVMYMHTVGANKTESKEVSNVAMESTTMTTEATSDDGVAGGKGALASKDTTTNER